MSIQQIQPQTNFPIARDVIDLGDGVTYYVQAIVRNATTNATITIVNLNNLGNRIFGNTWYAVSDPSGRGLYVTITTTVYTDSAYTAKSYNYQDESDTYIVYDQFHQLQGLATQLSALLGTESHIDYKKIKKIVIEVVALIEFPEYKQNDYTPTLAQLATDLKIGLGGIKIPNIPEYKETDLSPVIKHIKGVEERMHKRFDSIKDPSEPTDISPLLEKLDSLGSNKVFERLTKSADLADQLSNKIEATMPELAKYLVDFANEIKDFTYMAGKKEAQNSRKKPEQPLIESPIISRNGEVREK